MCGSRVIMALKWMVVGDESRMDTRKPIHLVHHSGLSMSDHSLVFKSPTMGNALLWHLHDRQHHGLSPLTSLRSESSPCGFGGSSTSSMASTDSPMINIISSSCRSQITRRMHTSLQPGTRRPQHACHPRVDPAFPPPPSPPLLLLPLPLSSSSSIPPGGPYPRQGIGHPYGHLHLVQLQQHPSISTQRHPPGVQGHLPQHGQEVEWGTPLQLAFKSDRKSPSFHGLIAIGAVGQAVGVQGRYLPPPIRTRYLPFDRRQRVDEGAGGEGGYPLCYCTIKLPPSPLPSIGRVLLLLFF